MDSCYPKSSLNIIKKTNQPLFTKDGKTAKEGEKNYSYLHIAIDYKGMAAEISYYSLSIYRIDFKDDDKGKKLPIRPVKSYFD